ncbi:DUF5958 family protein [Streptomyces sp. IBSNAI002]|uniref:DUF5958 family protein n=1 Tax=Streptomyces sp. IBSNAI002 TaxID=3457500 RepID=UPI003FD67D0E
MVLNVLAQGIRPLDQGVGWFESLAGTEQFEVLRDLAGFCIQARVLIETDRTASAGPGSGPARPAATSRTSKGEGPSTTKPTTTHLAIAHERNSGGVISWRSSHSTVRLIRESGGAPWPALPGKTTSVDRVIVDRRFRGQGLGIYLTGLALDYLSHGAGVIALVPGSLEDDDTPVDVARERLGRAWSRFGFQHCRNGTWILACEY